MMYLLAVVLPPLALLIHGHIIQAIFNLILFILSIVFAIFSFGTLWMICVAWAIIVLYRDRQEARTRRIIEETIRSTER